MVDIQKNVFNTDFENNVNKIDWCGFHKYDEKLYITKIIEM